MQRGWPIAIVLVACSKSEPQPTQAGSPPAPLTETPKVDAAPVDAALATPPPLPITRPGPAFILGHGAYAIGEDGSVTTLDRRDAIWNELAVDQRGRPWVWESSLESSRSTLVVYEGTRRRVVQAWNDVHVSLAPARDGGMWILADTFLAKASPAWKVDRRPLPVGPDETAVQPAGALVDGGDVVWLSTTAGIYRFTIGTRAWERMREGKHGHLLVRDAAGTVWTVDDGEPDKLVGYDGTRWIELALPAGIATIASLAADTRGRVYAVLQPPSLKEKRRLGVFGLAGGIARWESTALGDVRDMDEIHAIDDAGRLWITRGGGLLVMRGDGTPIVELPFGTLKGMAGSIIHAVGIAREGPATLPAPAPIPTASIRGQIVSQATKTPLAGLEVDLCSVGCTQPASGPVIRIVTDARGRFQVDDVPIVEYSAASPAGSRSETGVNIVFQHAGRELECCLQARPGTLLDLGTLEYHW